MIETPHRYQAFDSLRSIAALVVLLMHGHLLFGFFVPKLPWPLSGLLDSKAAVAFFFVLSGFVLHLSFSKTLLSFQSFAGFQVRRIFRVYPLYYLSLLAVVAVIYSQDKNAFPQFLGDGGGATNVLSSNHRDMRQWLEQLLLVGPGFDMYFLNPPAWTLAVEMRVAILFPFFSWMISKLNIGKGAIFLAASLPCAFAIGKFTHLGFIELIPLFLMGAFFAQHRNAILSAKISEWHILLIGAISFFLYSSRTSVRQLPVAGWYLCGLGSAGVLLVALRSGAVSQFLMRPTLLFLGELSYGIYILHFAILLGLSPQTSKFPPEGRIVFFLLGLLLTITISFVANRFIEKPFIALGKKLSGKLRQKHPIESTSAKMVETTVGPTNFSS